MSSSINYSKYEILFNSINDGIFLYTPNDFKLVDVNHRVSQMYGYSKDEILSSSVEKISAAEEGYTQAKANKLISKAIAGQTINTNWLGKKKDATNFWVNFYLKLIDIGGVDYLMVIVKDINDETIAKQSLEETQAHFESLAQNSPDIIMRFDKEHRHLYVNKAIESQLGLSTDKFLNKTHEEMGIFPEEMCRFWEESIEQVFTSNAKNVVYFSLPSTKGEIHIEWRLFPEFNNTGSVETVLGIARDITERIKNETVQNVLFEIANAANQAPNLDELFVTIQKSLHQIVDTTNCYVALYDEKTDTITLPFHKDQKDKFQEFPAGKTMTGYVIKTKKSQLVDLARIAELEASGEVEPIGALSVSWLGVPLKIAGKIIGVFVVQSYDESILYTHDDVQILEFVSYQIARAIEKKIDSDNLAHNEQRQRKIIESSPDGLVVIDLQGKILEANTKYYEITEQKADKDLGGNLFDLIVAKDVIKVQNVLNETLTSGYSRNVEFKMKKPKGSEFFAEASLGLITGTDKMEDTFVIIFKNINDRKLYEENLKKAKDKAEESDRLKMAFLSNMSHEIRTPMNAIVGFSELLSSNEERKGDSKEFIKQIKLAADSLMRLIDDILDISKIESGQLIINNSSFKLLPLFDELYPLFRNNLRDSRKTHIELILQTPQDVDEIQIYCDEFRLKQILINLVNNAIKFTDEGKITFGIKSFGTGKIEIFVKDTGIGIGPDKQKLIFERFRQGHENKDQFFGGTGLGLAISKSLAEAMNGTIKVLSKEGKGSEFVLGLPLPEQKSLLAEERFSEQEVAINWAGKNLLVAEDENSNFVLISELLKKTGINILRAENGFEVLEMIKANMHIDAILMDIQMPELNGYETTLEIRRMKLTIPVIAQTAYAMAGEREVCMSKGCNDYISKPIQPKELITKLGNYLNNR